MKSYRSLRIRNVLLIICLFAVCISLFAISACKAGSGDVAGSSGEVSDVIDASDKADVQDIPDDPGTPDTDGKTDIPSSDTEKGDDTALTDSTDTDKDTAEYTGPQDDATRAVTSAEPSEDGTATQTEPSGDETVTAAGTSPADTESAPADTESAADTSGDTEVLTLSPDPDILVTEPFDISSVEPQTMPRLDIYTDGNAGINSKEVFVGCSVTLSDCDPGFAFTELRAGIRLRGNSTAVGAKRPYRLKFESKTGMLGLNDGHRFKTWVLMADYYDSTMLRTYGTFKLADTLLDGIVFSSDCAHVELYLNGEFQGVYLLCEQSQIKKHRVGIDELDDGDTSVEQGYMLIGQGGRYDEPGNIQIPFDFTVRDRNGTEMHYGMVNFALASGDYTAEQKAYCSAYLGGVCEVIEAAVYRNEYYSLSRDCSLSPVTYPDGMSEDEKQIRTISAVFNLESCVRLCILDEIVKNLDAMTFNMYVDLSPEGEGRLTLAAPWDFDFSMANTKYDTLHSPLGWYATNLSFSDGIRVNPFYVLFGSVDWFNDMCSEVWKEKYPALQEQVTNLLIESARYDDAFSRDWALWGRPISGTFGHHCVKDLLKLNTHMDSAYFLYDWLSWRLRWLNAQWGDGSFDEAEYQETVLPGEKPDPNAKPVVIDMTDPDSNRYLSGFGHCWGTITEDGLLVEQTEAYDPQFYLDFEQGGLFLPAKDYPYLYITYRVPDSNPTDTYMTELFLCSGSFNHAVGGVSTAFGIEKTGDEYVTVKVDLRSSGYWTGDVHRIRVDYFSSCQPGDVIYIRQFELSNQ